MRLAVLLLAAFLAGCNLVYRIDVQQGNYITQDLVQKLKPGMTKLEVRTLLGTPLLADPFHANRWDYYFSSVGRGKAEDRTLFSVFFENDKLARFTGEARPAAAPPVNVPAPAKPATAATPAAAAPATAPPPAPATPPAAPPK
jgi:outer membrane protein assembly factor BamE